MTDQNFPHIIYEQSQSPQERGQMHGEEFAQGIKELSEIRKDLMLQKSPHLANHIEDLAATQAQMTNQYDPSLYEELLGISKGSGQSLSSLIILNNYTDFRDITLGDQGCTSLSMKATDTVSAQTWDMHESAKKYVCTIELPNCWTVFSLVGCLGMMGVNKEGLFIGVNNINTNDAKEGVIWSAFVRKFLERKNITEAKTLLNNTPFTSGHNYLISDGKVFEHWEASPTVVALASELKDQGVIYHTNHCLSPEVINIEETLSQNSTSKERFSIVEKKADGLRTRDDIKELLQGHEGYPKSVCGHFQSGAQDPSITCGGAIYDHRTSELFCWRGCREYDDNYKERTITLKK